MISPHIAQRAFTLVEMVIVIAVTGAMVAAVTLFLRWPFQAYLDTARRAELADAADTALRRISRDLRIALPNSVRVAAGAGGMTCMEMLPTRMGGRYRVAVNNTGAGDILNFNAADVTFDMFGPFSALPGQTPVTGDRVVVYNIGAASSGADAYNASNTNVIGSTGAGSLPNESKILFAGTLKRFPLESPGSRFQVINRPVSYACTPGPPDSAGNGTGILRRYSAYPVAAVQACPPAGGATVALLANNVTGCTFQYSATGATARNGLVSMQLAITLSNEAVNLYHEAHVNNAP